MAPAFAVIILSLELCPSTHFALEAFAQASLVSDEAPLIVGVEESAWFEMPSRGVYVHLPWRGELWSQGAQSESCLAIQPITQNHSGEKPLTCANAITPSFPQW